MRFSLLPREKIFFEHLEGLSLKAGEAAEQFKILVNSWTLEHEAVKKIDEIEHEADEIVQTIMINLNKAFIAPIDWEDIHHLATTIDDLIDLVHLLSKRMVIFQIERVTENLIEMATIFEKSVNLVVEAIHKLKNRKYAKEMLPFVKEINTLENQGDRAYESALSSLFQNSKDPIEIVKWKEIYDYLEMGIDKCEDIGDIIGGICVKYG